MRLALGTSWLVLAVVGALAAPTPARRDILLAERPTGHEQTRVYDICTEGRSSCRVERRDTNEPQLSTSTHVPVSTTTSSFSSTSGTISASSTSASLSSTQSTPSLIASDPLQFDNFAAQANPSDDSGDADNHLRTVGIVGGFLAGTALVAIIGIILILIRNQRIGGSSVASSFMSRSRTRSGARQPIEPMISQPHLPPITLQPPLRVHTGYAVTAASHDLTTAATAGHHSSSAGMHQFPSVTSPGSASSRTTSFGQHSSGTSSGGSNPPRRAPQIPSLGLSNPRPFLRSFGSLFSYHASTGHPTPTPTRVALDREEHEDHTQHTEQTEHTETTETTETTEVTAPSTFGSRTLAATEDLVRSDDHAQTEETGISEDIARTAETAHSGPPVASTENQPKAS